MPFMLIPPSTFDESIKHEIVRLGQTGIGKISGIGFGSESLGDGKNFNSRVEFGSRRDRQSWII
jgi:hypothetical protein